MTQQEFDAAFSSGGVERLWDCDTIRKVAYETLGIVMTQTQAEQIWEEYSETFCAGWLIVGTEEDPEDDPERIIEAIEIFVNRRNE